VIRKNFPVFSLFNRETGGDGFARDSLLLDSGRPQAPITELGGTGRVHDWSLSRKIVAEASRPVFLAGGIRPENAAEAYRQVRPFGIDLCTGVRRGGRLDAERLSGLFAALAPTAP
jgi:phosphoribosylanthranilate isomerase